MNSSIYCCDFAKFYDVLNSGVDYPAFAEFVCNSIAKFSEIPVFNICELACGTGNVAISLAKRGFHVTASDFSADMLSVAENKSRNERCEIRFILQDMQNTALYSKQDAFVCFLDSINYLKDKNSVISTFSKVYDNLSDKGLFIFDVNSKFKFENIYADNAYILEQDGIVCNWQNFYNKKSHICNFYLSFFERISENTYKRFDECHTERMYTIRNLTDYLVYSGFSVEGIFSSFNFKCADEKSDERLFFVAKKATRKGNV